jgi:Protein of unknown function (DUF4238)
MTEHAHVVPAGYLRGFGSRVDLSSPAIFLAARRARGGGSDGSISVRDAAVRSHFYAFEDAAGVRNSAAEFELSKLENLAVPVIRAVSDGVWPLPDADKAILAEFFGLLLIRGPRWKRFHAELAERFLVETAPSLIAETPGATAEHLERFADRLRSDVTWIERMFSLSYKSAAALGSMQWNLVEFARPIVCTCDHPVVLWLADGQSHKPAVVPMNTGLLNTLEVRVPLTATSALVLTWADTEDARVSGRREDASQINVFTVAQSEYHWFHRPGVTPPVTSGGRLAELSSRMVRGYDLGAMRSSSRRTRISEILNSQLGEDGNGTFEMVVGVRPVVG